MKFLFGKKHINYMQRLADILALICLFIVFTGCQNDRRSRQENIETSMAPTSVDILDMEQTELATGIDGTGNTNQVYNNGSNIVQCGRRLYFIVPTNSNELNMDICYYDILTQTITRIDGSQFILDNKISDFEITDDNFYISSGYIYVEVMAKTGSTTESDASKINGVIRISPTDLSVKFYVDAEVLMTGNKYIVLHFIDSDSDCIYNGNEVVYNVENSMFCDKNKLDETKNQIIACQDNMFYYILGQDAHSLVEFYPDSLKTRTLNVLPYRNATQCFFDNETINFINYEDDSEICYRYKINTTTNEVLICDEERKEDVFIDKSLDVNASILQGLDDDRKNDLKDKVATFGDIECVYDDLENKFIYYDIKSKSREEITFESFIEKSEKQ